jgi:O-antigen/teichoic acid export membrane protein
MGLRAASRFLVAALPIVVGDEGGLICICWTTGIEWRAIVYRDWSVWLGALISLAASALAILIARRELTRKGTSRGGFSFRRRLGRAIR